jgi:anti-sigma regulatory factor (Ser/Thr protein kinase)
MIPDWERQRAFVIADSSHTAQVRRFATQLADAAGLSQSESGKIAIITTELATNLLKHAKGGQMLIRPLADRHTRGVELISLDGGGGMVNFAQWLRDGYSTAGTSGTGLGAITRLATEFDVQSIVGKGTAVMARSVIGKQVGAPTDVMKIGAVCIPMQGEERCGDSWSYESLAERCIFVLVDGLGHGVGAADAAERAVTSVQEHKTKSPAAIMEHAHDALRGTRGAALALAVVDFREQVLRYCAVGNISARIINADAPRHLVSLNGIVGHAVHKISEFTYSWSSDSVLIMHSDGLMSRWDLGAYPGLLNRHPSLIAGILYRDFSRGRDDVTVIAAKQQC